jgi:squalene monooxygenase
MVILDSADIIVVGGGVLGLASACALADGSRRVLVLETQDHISQRFRGELIHASGAAALAELGLGALVHSSGAARCHGFVVTKVAGGTSATLEYPVDSSPGCGFTMCHQEMLLQLLGEASVRPQLSVRMGEGVSGLMMSKGRIAGVRTKRGNEFRARLTIACDGRLSSVREMAGISSKTSTLSRMIVVNIRDSTFDTKHFGHVFVGGPSPIVAYGLACGSVRLCVDVPLPYASRRGQTRDLLENGYFAHLPSELGFEMLRAIEQDEFKVCSNVRVSALSCYSPGLVLLGDSAGCGHPLSARGISSGLIDLKSLREILDSRSGQASLTRKYGAKRRRLMVADDVFSQSLYEVLRGESLGDATLRLGMFRYWARSARGRRASMALLSGKERRRASLIREVLLVIISAIVVALSQEGDSKVDIARRVGMVVRVSVPRLRSLIPGANGLPASRS